MAAAIRPNPLHMAIRAGYPQSRWTAGGYVLIGEGAYAGLSAILLLMDNGIDLEVEGMVFPGDLPPMPDTPTE